MDRDNIKHDVWIVPSTFCTTCYINGGGYRPGDEAPELEGVMNVRKNDVELY